MTVYEKKIIDTITLIVITMVIMLMIILIITMIIIIIIIITMIIKVWEHRWSRIEHFYAVCWDWNANVDVVGCGSA